MNQVQNMVLEVVTNLEHGGVRERREERERKKRSDLPATAVVAES